ncbi:MAG: YkgJ family cysteine cluster protein [Planctomycetes bacterium]|nr:YkgJ family cysteine cluster protein [Planctomycetota bacterium]
MAEQNKEKWYVAGLAFECQQSGNCCSGEPGHVWVTKAEIAAIAKYLGIDDGWLPKKYLRRVGLRYSLTEHAGGDCIFLQRNNGESGCTGCRIHEVKPTQCRTWPFWDTNLKTPEYWNEAAKGCPGINRGSTHTFVQIEEIRLKKAPS